VWITSISGTPEAFNIEDMQGFQANKAYESSKRLTDLLVLTYDLPSTQPYVKTFLPTGTANSEPNTRPQMYSTHPGVVATSISGVNWFISIWMLLALYISRWIGSPWHPIGAYKGAVSAVFAALAPPSQLSDLELLEGKGKWGSATDVFGNERVVRTEIEGWGYGRDLKAVPSGSVRSNRKGSRPVTREGREEFESQGQKVWKEMETLRVEWEKRLGKVEVDAEESVDM
jgi:3-keto steroid reductase